MDVHGIVLAAGLSTRMGAAKLLLELQGIPILLRVLNSALGSGLAEVVLVTGPRSEALARVTEPLSSEPRFRWVENPRPELGMSSSLHRGLSALPENTAAAAIMLGDQPLVTHQVLDKLIRRFRREPDRIVVPSVRGRRTTPVIFPSDLFPDLMETRGDIGGREVVKRNPSRIVAVEMGACYDDSDVDTPEDLQGMMEKLNREESIQE